MKTNIILVGLLFTLSLTAQTTLALWDFRGANDYVGTSELWYETFEVAPNPDEYSTNNSNAKFFTDGSATNRALRKAATSSNGYCMTLGWGPALIENSDLYWYIYGINTTNVKSLNFSFQVWSSNTGPREFKVQYRNPNAENIWVDLHVGNLNFTSAKAPHSFALPVACENKSHIDLRILRASSYQLTNPATVVSGSGQSRIDDVLIVGTLETPNLAANLSNENIKIYTTNNTLNILGAAGKGATIYSLTGSKIAEQKNLTANHEIKLSGSGIYIVHVHGKIFKVKL